MIIGFKPRFKEPILRKIKKTTIREDKHNRWRAGMAMHMATGVRTKLYSCFVLTTCTGTQTITMDYFPASFFSEENVTIYVDGRRIGHYFPKRKVASNPVVDLIAKNDGFDSTEDFFNWFNKDFTGKIIHWTDLKY